MRCLRKKESDCGAMEGEKTIIVQTNQWFGFM